MRKLLREAAQNHVKLYQSAMTGNGVDRHLFTLYVVSRYLGLESKFLDKALTQQWKLSTSQVNLSHRFPICSHRFFLWNELKTGRTGGNGLVGLIFIFRHLILKLISLILTSTLPCFLLAVALVQFRKLVMESLILSATKI